MKTIRVIGCLLLAAYLQPSTRAQNPPISSPNGTHSKLLSESVRRVIVDSSPFGPGKTVPYWDRGYLISTETETFLPGKPNVSLYDEAGQKVREATIWFPGSQRVSITSAAVTSDGRILASGEADKPDGTRATFIASTDLNGKMTGAIQTGDFYPRNICAAPDGTVWSFGGMFFDEQTKEPKPGETLRHFDFQRGQLGAFIPRSTFPVRPSFDSLAHIRCSSAQVVALSSRANVYIELAYGSDSPRLFQVVPLPSGFMLAGFAVLAPREVYANILAVDGRDNDGQGLYTLEFNGAANTTRWVPVEKAGGLPSDSGAVSRLWGADGEYLVVSRSADPAGRPALHWAKPLEK